MSFLSKPFKKKTKKGLPREAVLQLKPIRNQLLKWNKSKNDEVVITQSLKESKKARFLSKMFPVPKEKRVKLDRLGSFVWNRCDGKHRVKDIIQELCDEFKLTRQEAEVSLSNYLQQLAERKFIGVLVPKKEEKRKEKPSVLRKVKLP